MPSGLSFRTARYSRMRRLTFSRPKWSSSSTVLASAMSMAFCVLGLPGQLGHPLEPGAQHRCLAAALAHAREALEFLLRVLERVLGHAGVVDAPSSAPRSRPRCPRPRPAPSGSGASARAARARAGARRTPSCVLSPISLDRRSTSTRSPRCSSTLSRRCLQVEGLEDRLLFLVLHVEQVGDHVGEQRGRSRSPAPPPRARRARSAAAGSPRPPASFSCRKRASISGRRLPPGLDHATRATRNGQPSRNSSTRKRGSPCTTRWCAPSLPVT